MKREILIGGDAHTVALINLPTGPSISVGGQTPARLELSRGGNDEYRFDIGGNVVTAKAIAKGEHVFVEAFGRLFTLTVLDPVEQAHQVSEAGDPSAKAPMPGVVVELHTAKGDKVAANQPLLTIESMKLLAVIRAAGEGIVVATKYQPGDPFNKGDVLVKVQAQERQDA